MGLRCGTAALTVPHAGDIDIGVCVANHPRRSPTSVRPRHEARRWRRRCPGAEFGHPRPTPPRPLRSSGRRRGRSHTDGRALEPRGEITQIVGGVGDIQCDDVGAFFSHPLGGCGRTPCGLSVTAATLPARRAIRGPLIRNPL